MKWSKARSNHRLIYWHEKPLRSRKNPATFNSINGKSMKQYKNDCAFCGARNSTREHIIPVWLGKKYETQSNSTSFNRKISKDVTSGQTEDNSKTTGRPATSITIKRFCADCNNGWMSTIEEKMKLIFEKIEKSLFYLRLTQNEMKTLVEWSTLKTIEWNLTCEDTAWITAKDMTHFHQHRRPPEDWKIYIGYYNDLSTPPEPYFLQLASLLSDNNGPNNRFENRNYNCQSTSICIPPLFIHVICHTSDLANTFKSCYQNKKLARRIWPNTEALNIAFKTLEPIDRAIALILNHTYGGAIAHHLESIQHRL